jgi:hypothetical protein
MAANIMQNWGSLAPKNDFYGSFMQPIKDTQLLQQALLQNEQKKMQNQMTQEQMPYNIQMIEAALQGKQLGNQQTQMNMDYQPKEFAMKEQELALRNALMQQQSQRLNGGNPFAGPAAVQTAAYIDFYEKNGQQDMADLIRSQLGSARFSNMNADAKRDWDARARALDIDSNTAMQVFNGGGSLEDYARSIGVSEERIADSSRNYPATTPTITSSQRKMVANVGSEKLVNIVNDFMAPYQNDLPLIEGFSLDQIIDYAKQNTKNDEELVKFVAGSWLIPEAIGLQAQSIINGQVGIEALNHFQENYPIKLQAITKVLTPKQREDAFKIYNDVNGYISAIEQEVASNIPKYQGEGRERIAEFEKKYGDEETKDMQPMDLQSLPDDELEEYGRSQGWQ